MVTKDDQQGRVGEGIVPTNPTTTESTPGSKTDESKGDESWKQNFPQAAATGTAREDYQKTADERRAQAQLAAQLEQARKAEVEGEPTPSGNEENPHSEEPAVDPEDPNPTTPEQR